MNDYVSTFTSLSSGKTTHTLEAWVYLDRLPTSRAGLLVLGQYGADAHHWLVNANGKLDIGVWNGNQIANNPTLPLRTWTHLATVFNGTNLTFYVNGQQFGQTTPATFNFNINNPLLTNPLLTLGQGLSGESNFPGKIRDVRVWNTARTAAQINDNKNNPFISDQTDLLIGNYIATPYVDLDGNNDYVSGSTGLAQGTTSHTLEAWVYLDQLPSSSQTRTWLLGLGQQSAGSEHWIINSSGTTGIGVWNGSQVPYNISVGQWTHLATVFNGTTLTLYANGQQVGQPVNATFNLTNNTLNLGKSLAYGGYFKGQIRDVRVWNIARTQQEINNNKNTLLNGDETGLIANYQGHWTLDKKNIVSEY